MARRPKILKAEANEKKQTTFYAQFLVMMKVMLQKTALRPGGQS
jgi:hypothetical protein